MGKKFFRWSIVYFPRWIHDYSVKLAVAATMAGVGAFGAYYGTAYVLPRSQPEPKIEVPYDDWQTEVIPSP